MMPEHLRLVTFLGTGDYAETTYGWVDGRTACRTRFVALALATFLDAEETRVVATRGARDRHEAGLREAFAGAARAVRVIEIPEGRDESELWRQFEALREALEESAPERVAVDITHGFRAQPFFAAAAIALLRSVRGPNLPVEVYYGEYRKGAQCSPVWDLSLFVELLDWAHGAGLLMRTGFASDLLQVMGARDRAVRRELAQVGGRAFPNTRLMVRALEGFANDLATVRIASLITGYAQDVGAKARALASSARLIEAIGTCREDVEAHLRPLAAILDALAERVRPLVSDSLGGDNGQRAMKALARLYLQWERYPEAAVVVREAAVSRWAEGLEAVDVKSPRFDEQARTGAERRWHEQAGHDAKTMAEIRNDIEHGGFRSQPLSGVALKERIGDLVQSLEAAGPPGRASRPRGRTYFVSRHPGAREWAGMEGIGVDEFVAHLDVGRIGRSDTVIGSLPINLAAEVCARGGRYLHLSLTLPPGLRGKELTAEDLQRLEARLEPFDIRRLESDVATEPERG
jgi:CRISPR-associated protein Csx16